MHYIVDKEGVAGVSNVKGRLSQGIDLAIQFSQDAQSRNHVDLWKSCN